MKHAFPSHLTDDALVAEVRRLAGDERAATVQLVAHLAIMDERQLHLKAGFKSLFVYCLEILHLSEHATYNRIEAARQARSFPVILDRLADGSATLTTVRLLAPHLTAENHEALLREASHRRTEAVKEIVARIAPRPDVATVIRKLPIARATGAPPATAPAPTAVLAAPTAPAVAPQAPPGRPAAVTPLAPDRYELRLTVTASTRQKLQHARNLLGHAVPTGDHAEIIDRALTVLIESLERKKFAATAAPRTARATSSHSRHIPAAVRRAVWARDGARCAFVGDAHRRCDARSPLEFHHRSPYEASGPATVENIELRCAGHNRYEADLYFGPIRAARDEGLVKETAAPYGSSVRPSTRFETSCVPNTQ